MDLEDAREGRRYRVTWEQCESHQCGTAEGSFTAVLLRKTWKDPVSSLGPFLESVTWDNGVTTGGYGYEAKKTS